MSYVTMADLAQVHRKKKPRRYFVPGVTQRTSDEDFTASAKGQEAFGGMAFESPDDEDAPIFETGGHGSAEPGDIDPGLGQLPLATAQAPTSLGMLDTVATALAIGAGVVLVGSWLLTPSKEKTANPGSRRCLHCNRLLVEDDDRCDETGAWEVECRSCRLGDDENDEATANPLRAGYSETAGGMPYGPCETCGKTGEVSFDTPRGQAMCSLCSRRAWIAEHKQQGYRQNPTGLLALLSGVKKGDSLGRSKMVSMIDRALSSGALDASAVRKLKRLRSKIADGETVGSSEIASIISSIVS